MKRAATLLLLVASIISYAQAPIVRYSHKNSGIADIVYCTAYIDNAMLLNSEDFDINTMTSKSNGRTVSVGLEVFSILGEDIPSIVGFNIMAKEEPLYQEVKKRISSGEEKVKSVIMLGFDDYDSETREMILSNVKISITENEGELNVRIPLTILRSLRYSKGDSYDAIKYHINLLSNLNLTTLVLNIDEYKYVITLHSWDKNNNYYNSNSSVLFKALFDHVEEDFKTYGVSQASHPDRHEYVDLGLSVKWATCNLGATRPEEYGDYFAWAEISTKKDYLISNNKYILKDGDYTKYSKYNTNKDNGVVDNLKSLTSSDDAAHYNWGGAWHIPTLSEWQELYRECTWKWTTVNGVKGYQITSQKTGYTGKSIFLPAAGFRLDSHNSHVNSSGFYWSSSLYTDNPLDAFLLDFNSKHYYFYCINRFYGVSIRPVRQ